VSFEKQAPLLAAEAIRGAVEKAGVLMEDVDALLLCTCTGFLCPGVTSYVAELLGVRTNALLQDMTGLGCGAAVPVMRLAKGMIAENPEAVVVTVAIGQVPEVTGKWMILNHCTFRKRGRKYDLLMREGN